MEGERERQAARGLQSEGRRRANKGYLHSDLITGIFTAGILDQSTGENWFDLAFVIVTDFCHAL